MVYKEKNYIEEKLDKKETTQRKDYIKKNYIEKKPYKKGTIY